MAAPPNVRDAIVSVPELPLPLATIFDRSLDTETAPTVPFPSKVPSASVTGGVEATELVITNLAPLPWMMIPLLVLIAPVAFTSKVPPVTLVSPV